MWQPANKLPIICVGKGVYNNFGTVWGFQTRIGWKTLCNCDLIPKIRPRQISLEGLDGPVYWFFPVVENHGHVYVIWKQLPSYNRYIVDLVQTPEYCTPLTYTKHTLFSLKCIQCFSQVSFATWMLGLHHRMQILSLFVYIYTEYTSMACMS